MVGVSGPAKTSEHRGHGNDEGSFWSTWDDLDGHSDHDLDVWLQQRFDSGGSANLLRDGARWSLLQARWNTEFTTCSGGRADSSGDLDVFADVAANGDG